MVASTVRAQIALVGDFNPEVVAHKAIQRCFDLAGPVAGLAVHGAWLRTDEILPHDDRQLADFHGVWCVPGSPYRSTGGALWAIESARTRQVPFLGTCGGFQHALLEYARNALGLRDAGHAENDPATNFPLLHRMACSLVETTQSIIVARDGKFKQAYGADSGIEGFHCSFGLNPEFAHLFADGPLRLAAGSEAGEPRGFELDGHPFFLGTLFQPERRALAGTLHPLVRAFFSACTERATT